jgi:hypothetical protein
MVHQVYIKWLFLAVKLTVFLEIWTVIKIKTVTQLDTELLHNTDRWYANCIYVWREVSHIFKLFMNTVWHELYRIVKESRWSWMVVMTYWKICLAYTWRLSKTTQDSQQPSQHLHKSQRVFALTSSWYGMNALIYTAVHWICDSVH